MSFEGWVFGYTFGISSLQHECSWYEFWRVGFRLHLWDFVFAVRVQLVRVLKGGFRLHLMDFIFAALVQEAQR